MPGIRRITINNNPMMGDQGAALLAEALKDDLWLKGRSCRTFTIYEFLFLSNLTV
jgi:hypothetical protein